MQRVEVPVSARKVEQGSDKYNIFDVRFMDNTLMNPFIVMTKADFEATVIKMAAQMQPTPAAINNVPAGAVINPKTESDGERYLSRKETADLLKVDFSTLWRWNKSGLLRSKKIGPRRVLYRYDDVMQFINGKSA